MIVQNKITLRQRRDFGDMFGAVVQIIRANFGLLLGSIFVIVGPYLLTLTICMTVLQQELLPLINEWTKFRGDFLKPLNNLLLECYGWIFLFLLSSIFTFAFLRATVANFLFIYDGKAEGESFSISEISKKTYNDINRILLAVTIMFFIVCFILCLIVVPFGILIYFGNIALPVLLGFLLLFAYLAFGPQLIYIFQFASFFVMVRDNVFIFEAMRKVRKTIKGNFWWIWLIMVCMYFVVGILSFITNVPAVIFQPGSIFSRFNEVGSGVGSSTYIFFYALGLICTTFIRCLGDLIVGVSYYSFEEGQTGQELSKKIEEIGRQEENPNYI
jgi:hypothetical protein